MSLILLVLFYVLAPFAILHLCHKFPFVNKLGAVFIAYVVGLLLGNLGLLPEGSAKIQDLLTSLTIPLAIPLLLFGTNIREWSKIAGTTIISLVAGIVSVVIVVIAGFFIFREKGIADLWKVSGMLIGVYTGGTPNLASLKMMLKVDPDTYILTHTYDMIVSTVYLTFLITIGKKVFHLFLNPFRDGTVEGPVESANGDDPYWGIFRREKFYPLLKAWGVAMLIFAVGGGLSFLVSPNQQIVVVILTITTLSILVSLLPTVNRIEKTFESGMYLILIFSIVVASMADVTRFAGLTPGLFMYITFAVFGSLTLHVVFAKLFKVDADTVIITSTALICSPPFVPVIAGAIGNRKVILSGIGVGIIGYAMGNYLGYFIAEFLKGF